MGDHYRLDGPTLISFSGGRTSGYMLWRFVDRYEGNFPQDAHVCFANTGREMPATLDFVRECELRWGIPIVWLEYDPTAELGFDEVNHNSASRNGEPYTTLIKKRKYLPNPVQRFCTTELKVNLFKKYMNKHLGYKAWENVVGLRGDEPGRALKALDPEKQAKEMWTTRVPLYHDNVSEAVVMDFWAKEDFDLKIKKGQGNCDLCFLKSKAQLQYMMKQDPKLAEWWIDREKDIGGTFRSDRPAYAKMLDEAQRQSDFDFGSDIFDNSLGCTEYCTD